MVGGRETNRNGRIAAGIAAAAIIALGVPLAGGLGQAAGKKHHKQVQKRPNIVLIMDDDQAAEQQRFLTKTNTALGAHGVTFTNSFVSYSLCCPSRSTLLTGQYAHNDGVRGNSPPSGGYSKLAPTLSNSLPVWLQRSGYATAHIGKFLNGYGTTSPDTEVPPGWTEWYGSLDDPDNYPGGTYTQYGYTLNENGSVVHFGTTPDVVDPATNQTDVYSRMAADFIRRRASSRQPFYLSVAPNAPHAEAAVCNCAGNNPRAPVRYEGTLASVSPPITPNFNEADVSDKPTNIRNLPLLTPTAISNVYARYRARSEALLGVDDMVQNVVSTLKSTGELNNTVIIFTSDNGFFHGEHRVPQGKVRLYEPSVRVPLLIRAPGLPKGVKRSDPVVNADLTPTILDFANAKAGRREDGHSLVPEIKQGLLRSGRAILLETFFNADTDDEPDAPPLNYQAVRSGPYLYAKYGTGEQELYDLNTDPYELQSRAGDPALGAVRASLDRLLGRLGSCAGSVCRSQPPAKLKVRSRGGRCAARVVGHGSGPQRAIFYLGNRKLGTDGSAPLEHGVSGGAGAKLRANVSVLDGRVVSLTRRLPAGC
jgi:N-acetylglucosamine-6-sulfatase